MTIELNGCQVGSISNIQFLFCLKHYFYTFVFNIQHSFSTCNIRFQHLAFKPFVPFFFFFLCSIFDFNIQHSCSHATFVFQHPTFVFQYSTFNNQFFFSICFLTIKTKTVPKLKPDFFLSKRENVTEKKNNKINYNNQILVGFDARSQ